MSHRAKELIAGHGAAQLGSRKAAAGNDQSLTFNGFASAGDNKAGFCFFDPVHLETESDLNIALFQSKTQNIHNRIGLIGVRVYPSAVFGHSI